MEQQFVTTCLRYLFEDICEDNVIEIDKADNILSGVEMATRAQDISRFCINYQKFIILIVIVLAIQIFLAIRVVLLPGSWDVISGDGSKGPYYKKLSPRMEVEEVKLEKIRKQCLSK